MQCLFMGISVNNNISMNSIKEIVFVIVKCGVLFDARLNS
jgi:hypothetical protein